MSLSPKKSIEELLDAQIAFARELKGNFNVVSTFPTQVDNTASAFLTNPITSCTSNHISTHRGDIRYLYLINLFGDFIKIFLYIVWPTKLH